MQHQNRILWKNVPMELKNFPFSKFHFPFSIFQSLTRYTFRRITVVDLINFVFFSTSFNFEKFYYFSLLKSIFVKVSWRSLSVKPVLLSFKPMICFVFLFSVVCLIVCLQCLLLQFTRICF